MSCVGLAYGEVYLVYALCRSCVWLVYVLCMTRYVDMLTSGRCNCCDQWFGSVFSGHRAVVNGQYVVVKGQGLVVLTSITI